MNEELITAFKKGLVCIKNNDVTLLRKLFSYMYPNKIVPVGTDKWYFVIAGNEFWTSETHHSPSPPEGYYIANPIDFFESKPEDGRFPFPISSADQKRIVEAFITFNISDKAWELIHFLSGSVSVSKSAYTELRKMANAEQHKVLNEIFGTEQLPEDYWKQRCLLAEAVLEAVLGTVLGHPPDITIENILQKEAWTFYKTFMTKYGPVK